MDNLNTVNKMINLIEKIQKYIIGYTYDTFIENEMVVEVCAFNLSRLGELSHKLDDEFQHDNSAIPWKAIYGMRNKIIHDYDSVNMKVVWETITKDLQPLSEQLKQIYDKK